MIYEYTKSLEKCTKSELILIIQGQIEGQKRLLDLIDDEWEKSFNEPEDPHRPKYISNEKQSYLDGLERALNIVDMFINPKNKK